MVGPWEAREVHGSDTKELAGNPTPWTTNKFPGKFLPNFLDLHSAATIPTSFSPTN